MAGDGRRVRHQLDLVVVRPGDGRAAAPLVGSLTQWEDGRYVVRLPGLPPVAGDRHEGGRRVVAALLAADRPPVPEGAAA
jgi:hypothetical protein